MTRLGDLERAVMDVLWDGSDSFTVREVAAALPNQELAYTTVMTVLDRLAKKALVHRDRHGRAWRYTPTASREAYVAELMHEALEFSDDRAAALVSFARSMSGDEADALRAALPDPRRVTPKRARDSSG